MDRLVTPEMSINVPSRYILYPAFSSPLSSFLPFEFSDTIPRIEEEIGNDIDEDRLDGEIEINDEMGDIDVYSRPRDRTYDYMRRKFQKVADVLSSIKWRFDYFLLTW